VTPAFFRRRQVGEVLEVGVIAETLTGRPLAFQKVGAWLAEGYFVLTPEEAEEASKAFHEAAVWARNASRGRVAVDLAEARRRAAEHVEAGL